MPDLCERIGKVTGRPVIDKTGLTGRYIIILSYATLGSTNPDASDSAPDIAAVRDQLGLRLEPQRTPLEMLKVESDRIPTPTNLALEWSQMQHTGLPEMLPILVVMVLMFSGQRVHEIARTLAEAISKFKGGGPGSPSHPIPADDSRILTRKPKRPEQRQS